MSDFDQTVVLVTGAGRGIGAGIAAHLASRGATVALMGRTRGLLEESAAQIASSAAGKCSVHAGSVGDEADVERVVAEVLAVHGHIDVLVNNAGTVDLTDFLSASWEGWQSVIATNLSGVFLMTQRVARRMRDRGGCVVNIASIDAYGTDGPQASYTAAKAGVIGLTKAAATELARYKIRVNSVSPGWVRTPLVEQFLPPAALKHMRDGFDRVPMRRMVEIDEVAQTVAFLASPAASAITGIDLPVDCGTLSNLYLFETLPT
jgi:meso-butanediol dehydrogenase / (S,S)-butanediol dehydrogenase / diacetyl reductase